MTRAPLLGWLFYKGNHNDNSNNNNKGKDHWATMRLGLKHPEPGLLELGVHLPHLLGRIHIELHFRGGLVANVEG